MPQMTKTNNPNSSLPAAFFTASCILHCQLQDFSLGNVVIGGDFNCAVPDKDKKGGNAVTQKASVIKEIKELCTSYNLVDIWRRLNPFLESYTWRNKSQKIQCRLDFFLISEELANLDALVKFFMCPKQIILQFCYTFRPHLKKNSEAQVSGNLIILYEKMTTMLQLNYVKRTPQDYINEFTI